MFSACFWWIKRAKKKYRTKHFLFDGWFVDEKPRLGPGFFIWCTFVLCQKRQHYAVFLKTELPKMVVAAAFLPAIIFRLGYCAVLKPARITSLLWNWGWLYRLVCLCLSSPLSRHFLPMKFWFGFPVCLQNKGYFIRRHWVHRDNYIQPNPGIWRLGSAPGKNRVFLSPSGITKFF